MSKPALDRSEVHNYLSKMKNQSQIGVKIKEEPVSDNDDDDPEQCPQLQPISEVYVQEYQDVNIKTEVEDPIDSIWTYKTEIEEATIKSEITTQEFDWASLDATEKTQTVVQMNSKSLVLSDSKEDTLITQKVKNSRTLQHKCDICDKILKTKMSLIRHKLIHSEAQLQCPHCDKKFRHHFNMKKHIETDHIGGVSDFKCDQCKKLFKTKIKLYLHYVDNNCFHSVNIKPFKCDVCGKCFKFEEYLKRHKTNTHDGAKYTCSVCYFKFKQMHHLKRHFKKQHNEVAQNPKYDQIENKFMCEENRHDEIVHPVSNKIWKCDECEECYEVIDNLMSHKRILHGETQYCCFYCGMKFMSNYNLKCHIKTQHIGGIYEYKCNQCEIKFVSRVNFLNHVKTVHGPADLAPCVKSWICDECGQSFKVEKYLKVHKQLYHIKFEYSCVPCDLKFNQKGELNNHNEIHHSTSGFRNFKCDECGQCFKVEKYLKVHKQLYHIKFEYSCVLCDLKFYQKGELNNHNEIHHSIGFRNFKCDECEKCFKVEKYLKVHKQLSHIKFEYSCFRCDLKFTSIDILKRHRKTHRSGLAI